MNKIITVCGLILITIIGVAGYFILAGTPGTPSTFSHAPADNEQYETILPTHELREIESDYHITTLSVLPVLTQETYNDLYNRLMQLVNDDIISLPEMRLFPDMHMRLSWQNMLAEDIGFCPETYSELFPALPYMGYVYMLKPFSDRQLNNLIALYNLLGVTRDDKIAELEKFRANIYSLHCEALNIATLGVLPVLTQETYNDLYNRLMQLVNDDIISLTEMRLFPDMHMRLSWQNMLAEDIGFCPETYSELFPALPHMGYVYILKPFSDRQLSGLVTLYNLLGLTLEDKIAELEKFGVDFSDCLD